MTHPATRSRPPKQARSQRTLHALLDAAERALRTRSYQELSLSELARDAGVTTGAFYARFRSKDDLLPRLYERYSGWLEEVIERDLAAAAWSGLDVVARVNKAADVICGVFETRSGLLRAMVIHARLQPAATQGDSRDWEDSVQAAFLAALCDRLHEGAVSSGARDDLPFAVYAAITVAREATLYPGLPMTRRMSMDRDTLRERIAQLLSAPLGVLQRNVS